MTVQRIRGARRGWAAGLVGLGEPKEPKSTLKKCVRRCETEETSCGHGG